MSDFIIVDLKLLAQHSEGDNQENTLAGDSGHLIYIDPEDKSLGGTWK